MARLFVALTGTDYQAKDKDLGNTIIEEQALKYGLSEEEVRRAWQTTIAYRQRNAEGEPPIWVVVGMMPNREQLAELAGLEDAHGNWRVFYAKAPASERIQKDLELIW